MIRSLAIALGTILVVMAMSAAGAQARTEFCPAGVLWSPGIPANTDGQSNIAVFQLSAYAPRTIVSATIVADTDGGWYSWEVTNVPVEVWRTWARSARLAVDFPEPVFVRHAWTVKARTSGDTLYGWDALGEVACGLPSFGRASYPPQKAESADGLPRVAATPIAPLFSSNCPHPFAEATVSHAVQPNFPLFAPRGLSYTSQIEVEIGDGDNLLDAWVYKSSGNRAVDASALAAARASSYKSAVSYCQKAYGDYLFRADFLPY